MPSSSSAVSGPAVRAHAKGRRGALSVEAGNFLRLALWLPIWLLVAATIAGLVIAYQVPHTYTVDVGAPQDEAFVRNFHSRVPDAARDYRWSDVYGYVAFPGLGGTRPFTVSVILDPGRIAPVTVIINGRVFVSQTMQPGWHSLVLPVRADSPQVLASRDTIIEFRAPDYRTPEAPAEPKGVKVAEVDVEQAASGPIIVPAFLTVAWSGAGVLLLYLLVGRLLVGVALEERARLWALIAASGASIYMVAALAASHISVSVDAQHWAITVLSALALLVAAEHIVSRFARLSPVQARAVSGLFALAFALRYGGMAQPQSVIIDMPWHMKWLETLLAGNWQALYYPGGLSEVPAEWGANVLIPKSPLFYFAFAPLAVLPFDLGTLVKWLICCLDSSVVFAVFWSVVRLGTSPWAAAAGAGLYALMPLAFRAFAYGILPTIFAQWLTVGVLVFTLALGNRAWRPVHWIAFTTLLALALLAFPTVALFLSTVLVATPILWWLSERRRGARAAFPFQWRLVVSLIIAWALAIVSYYGLYISLVLTSIRFLLTPQPGGGSTVHWPGGWLELLAWTADYVVSLLPALLAVGGLLLLLRKGLTETVKRALWLVFAWVAIAPLFVIANYRVDMIGKHLFFTMTPVAILGGVALWQLARRRRWSMALMSLASLAITWQALVFWVDRLVRASS